MSCSDTYYAAISAAFDTFKAAIAACNGNPGCEQAAVDAYNAACDAAYLAYVHCISSTGGGGGGV